MKENWNLNDILVATEFKSEIDLLSADLKLFAQHYSAKLAAKISEVQFVGIIQELETLLARINRIYAYPMLAESVDQTDNQIQYFKSLAKTLIVEFEDATRPLYHWLKGKTAENYLDDQNATRLFAALPKLKYQLQRSRDLAKRTLSEKEEEIIAKKTINGVSVVGDLRSMIETDQSYIYKNPQDNKYKTYHTTSELMKLVYSKDHKVRKNAYQALFKPYKRNQQKFYTIYESVIKDWHDEYVWRKYDSAIAVRNEANNIPDKAVANLIKSCEDNTYIFHKFFKFKAQLLKINKLTRYDLYSPTGSAKEKEYSYAESKELVLRLFKEFDQEFYQFANSIFEDQHVDSHPNKVKRSGAYCATVTPAIKPYVFLNFAGTQRDVLTMAHELGHAVHSRFAEKQEISTQEAPLTLAETASTLAEMIVFDYLYEHEKDKSKKQQMLISKLSETYATIIRQIYFVKFEVLAHQRVVSGIQLEDFNQLYLDTLKEQFGDAVEVPEIFKYEWTYIPHIVNSPFYCYSYAFGELLSLALYARYKKQGAKFMTSIKEILSAGGAVDPTELLKEHGLDITKENFWDEGFSIINNWYQELVQMS
jgi:oligoendopeptidase F